MIDCYSCRRLWWPVWPLKVRLPPLHAQFFGSSRNFLQTFFPGYNRNSRDRDSQQLVYNRDCKIVLRNFSHRNGRVGSRTDFRGNSPVESLVGVWECASGRRTPDFVAGNGRGYGDERYLRFCCCGSPIIIGTACFGAIANCIQ